MLERIALKGTGMFLRKLRLQHELTLTDMAKKLKTNKGTLSKMELDYIGISLATIRKLAKVYNVAEGLLLASILQNRFPKMTLNENIPTPEFKGSFPHLTPPLPEALCKTDSILRVKNGNATSVS